MTTFPSPSPSRVTVYFLYILTSLQQKEAVTFADRWTTDHDVSTYGWPCVLSVLAEF